MNKIHYLGAGLLALIGMTACESDEPANGGSTLDPNGKYIAINLTNASNANGSRADFQYEEGTNDENAIDVNQLRFFFFDDHGNPFSMEASHNVNSTSISSNMIKPNEITTNKVNNNGNQIANAVLVLGKAKGQGYDGAMPSKVLCVANADNETLKSYENKSLTDIEKILHSTAINNGYFIMTSSTYWNGAKTYCSNITADNIKSTPEDAEKAPVQIYIERLAARVEVTSFPTNDNIIYDSDITSNKFELTYLKWDASNDQATPVTNKQVYAEVSGWNVNTLASNMYGIKQITNYSDGTDKFFNSLDEWNTGIRCFWATTASKSATPEQFYPAAQEDTPSLSKGLNDKVYILANTADPFLEGLSSKGNDAFRKKINFARTYASKVLIGANLYIVDKDATSKSDEKFNMMYWGGTYYTPEALCHSIAKWNNVDDNHYVVCVRCNGSGDKSASDKALHCNVKFFKKEIANGITPVWGELVSSTNVNAQDEIVMEPAQYWNGMSYYILNISNQLYASAKNNSEMFGVVRNHIYRYTLTNFIGLGTPVASPDELTDVENPAFGETFVAAQLNILSWRLVANETPLQ